MSFGLGITTNGQVHGYYETMKALRELDKNAARRINRAINKAAEVVAQDARRLVVNDTLSGWARQLPGGTAGSRRRAYGGGYDDAVVRRGIVVKRKGQRKRGNELRSFVIIANTTPMGAIWEVAGRSSTGRTNAGRAMIRNITARDPGPISRTAWRAMDANRDNVTKEIAEQVDEARRIVQSMINRA